MGLAKQLAAHSLLLVCAASPVLVHGADRPRSLSIPIANQTLAGYTLSGIMVDPDHPTVVSALSGPPHVEAFVTITAFLYDTSAADGAPYGYVTANNLVKPGQNTICGLDNGTQNLPPHGALKKVRFQLSAAMQTASETANVIVP